MSAASGLPRARAATMELFFVFVVLGRLSGLVLGVCVCVRVFWDEALKAVGCELIVAEYTRLTGILLVGLGPQLPQCGVCCVLCVVCRLSFVVCRLSFVVC